MNSSSLRYIVVWWSRYLQYNEETKYHIKGFPQTDSYKMAWNSYLVIAQTERDGEGHTDILYVNIIWEG